MLCSPFFPGAEVLARRGERRGQWGNILCVDSDGGRALVCWDVWTLPYHGVLAYTSESLLVGSCDYVASDPPSCSQKIAAGVRGATALGFSDLIAPSDSGFCNGSVCVRYAIAVSVEASTASVLQESLAPRLPAWRRACSISGVAYGEP